MLQAAKALHEKYKARATLPKLNADAALAKLNESIQHRIKDDCPLAWLKGAVSGKVRCQVILRRRATVRGTLTGFIAAFDKHWNLLMKDVVEVTEVPTRPAWESRARRERVTWAGDIARAGEDDSEGPEQGSQHDGDKEEPAAASASTPSQETGTGTLAGLLEDDAPDFEEEPSPVKVRPEEDKVPAAPLRRRGVDRKVVPIQRRTRRMQQVFVKGNSIIAVSAVPAGT